MKIAIYGSRRQEPYSQFIKALLRNLALSGVELVMHRKLYAHLTDELGVSLPGVSVAPAEFADMGHVDMAVSIGGDGTFLRTAAWVGSTQTPILGINTGHLGYLAPVAVSEASAFVTDILEGNYDIEKRALIAVDAPNITGWPFALNEVVFSKDDSASMISARATLNQAELAVYKADGLIVATPTGSTAYNMSAGGPIVQPSAPVWVFTPIAAHSLGMRPLVVSDDITAQVTVEGRSHSFRLSVDGRSTTMPMGATVTLRRAPFSTLIVQPRDCAFPAVLHNKLMFS